MENKEAIKDFNKAITCLALELPEAIWSDVHLKWLKVHNEIGIFSSQNEELRKENEYLNSNLSFCKEDNRKQQGKINELIKENEELKELIHKYGIGQLQSTIDEKNKEIERLNGLIEQQEEKENNPYWYWGQCDAEGCMGVNCNGGGCWRETGYWKVCSKHSQDFRDGKPQPKMKQSAIDREASRDKNTGCLPTKNN